MEKGATAQKDLQKGDQAADYLQPVKMSITQARDEITHLLLSYGINENTGIIVEKCHEEAKTMAKKMKASNETNQCYLK